MDSFNEGFLNEQNKYSSMASRQPSNHKIGPLPVSGKNSTSTIPSFNQAVQPKSVYHFGQYKIPEINEKINNRQER